eukprot:TRINITY_DN8242_c0_g1_i7.p2 TRINITY_DN8242_c0_g1~~TRINITY_DN8242_c0_g1_i7.p2  ORF type:complete len:196 (-),score=54.92 TRINITY_DN8242_c0_g1_i7:337-924(-)
MMCFNYCMKQIASKHKAYRHFLYASDVKNLEQIHAKLTARLPQLLPFTQSNHQSSSLNAGNENDFDFSQSELRPIFYPMGTVDRFIEIAEPNTRKKIETCGILCGVEKDNRLYVKNILIPDQKGTADSCTTLNYEAILSYVMEQDMIVLGWIHTHPEYDCFLSSIDLHTHYGYQKLLPEAIAIVCSGLQVPPSEK